MQQQGNRRKPAHQSAHGEAAPAYVVFAGRHHRRPKTSQAGDGCLRQGAIMQPRDQLTHKEIQVATLVWEGLTNREIAKIIGTTEQVVKNYLRTTFDKLGVWSRLELALYIASHGGVNWVSELGLNTALRNTESEAERLLCAAR